MSNDYPLEPVNDWVVARKVQENDGPIAIPDGAEIGPPMAKVLACGPGQICEATGQLIPMPCKVGDILSVAIPEHSQMVCTIRGQKVFVFRQRHIVARVTGKVMANVGISSSN